MLVVLAAGGSGSRMGSDIPKQLLKIGGKTLLELCLDKFSISSLVTSVVIPAPEEWIADIRELTAPYRPVCNVTVVRGGESRQDSVLAALISVRTLPPVICIHDAVRPLFDPGLLVRGTELLQTYDGAVAAAPAVNTMKRVMDGLIKEDLPRDTVFEMHTPQMFRSDVYRKAWNRAAVDRISVTDDAAIMEHYGASVAVMPDSYDNIKITFPQDLFLAEYIMKKQTGDTL